MSAKVEKKVTEQSLEQLVKNDDDLKARKDLPELLKKWNTPASEESIKATAKALEEKKHKVTVVDTPAQALQIITEAVKGKSYYAGGSQTLLEMGYTDWAMEAKGEKDFKAQYFAAMSKGDQAGAQAAMQKGMSADVFISSAGAISEKGDIVWGSLTGTRLVHATTGANIIVVGSNKIVKNYPDAVSRLYEFQLPFESARVKLAYKIFTGSAINEFGALHAGNPFGAPGKVHIVILRGAYGF